MNISDTSLLTSHPSLLCYFAAQLSGNWKAHYSITQAADIVGLDHTGYHNLTLTDQATFENALTARWKFYQAQAMVAEWERLQLEKETALGV